MRLVIFHYPLTIVGYAVCYQGYLVLTYRKHVCGRASADLILFHHRTRFGRLI